VDESGAINVGVGVKVRVGKGREVEEAVAI
jgi:hypothetical protein